LNLGDREKHLLMERLRRAREKPHAALLRLAGERRLLPAA
jgi:hypothetical protein